MTITYVPPTGGEPNLLGSTITSQVLDVSGTRRTLSATLDGTGLIITLVADEADTALWAVGMAQMDVRVEKNGSVIYTDTLPFPVIPEITLI